MNEREVAREILDELLRGALAHSNGNGQPGAAPQVPAPPVAAVMRPSTWREPPVAGEVVGDGRRADAAPEPVTIDSDADLERFVRELLARCEDPGERAAIRSGRRRFALRRGGSGAPPAPGGALRVERGAVTERTVDKAAKAGVRLVLAPGAVLTPLARDKARTLGIEIEREHRC